MKFSRWYPHTDLLRLSDQMRRVVETADMLLDGRLSVKHVSGSGDHVELAFDGKVDSAAIDFINAAMFVAQKVHGFGIKWYGDKGHYKSYPTRYSIDSNALSGGFSFGRKDTLHAFIKNVKDSRAVLNWVPFNNQAPLRREKGVLVVTHNKHYTLLNGGFLAEKK